MRNEIREIRAENSKILESATKEQDVFKEQAAAWTEVVDDDIPILKKMTAKIDKQLEDTKSQNARYERIEL